MSYGSYSRGQQITLIRRKPKVGIAAYDDYGNVQYQATAKILRGVAVWPTSLTENTSVGEFERTTSYYTAALPLSEPVNNIDYVLWDGRSYEIAGEPAQYVSPHTGNGYQTITMRRVEG